MMATGDTWIYNMAVTNGGYAIPSVTLTSTGSGYTIPSTGTIANPGAIYTAGTISTSQLYQPTLLTMSGQNGTLLTIHYDGRIEWNGPLSKNVEMFLKSLEHNIDKYAAGEQALAKSYRKAIERCLRQIKKMDKDEFISMLERELDARLSKALWQELSKDDEILDD